MAVTIESEHDTPVQYEHTLDTGVESTHVQVDQKLEAAAKSHITWSVEGQQGEGVVGLFNHMSGSVAIQVLSTYLTRLQHVRHH